ncbi:hypothetical protein LINGRAHAP2_LOCUS4637 [Linum grandiflorum]
MHIDDALYSTKSRRNLLSYKDIRRNRYHIETFEEAKREYIAITSMVASNKYYLEKLPANSVTSRPAFLDRLGRLGIMG